jgi:SAM-dependent MidA family methyltransferase
LVTVDYGAERADLLNDPNRRHGTLRAFHRHQMIEDLLARPGECDLTTTLDWTQLKEAGAGRGLETARLQRLDQFLLDEGILDRLSEITADLESTAEVLSLNAGARELIMPYGLSPYFQVLVQRKIA